MPIRPACFQLPLIRLCASAALLAGCLFETRAPRTVALQVDSGFARFDPLVITFLDALGNAGDTLYRGPGGAGEDLRHLVVDGLKDSGSLRLEGFVGGRLAYRLDIPWPADTLFAYPRWTAVGKPIYPGDLEFVSLAFRQGRTGPT